MKKQNCWFCLICFLVLWGAASYLACSGTNNDNKIDAGSSGSSGSGHGPDAAVGSGTGTYKPEVPSGFVKISAGTFTMGSPNSDLCREYSEVEHQVTLTHGFEMMSREITQANFAGVMGYNPSHDKTCGDNCPVEWINWFEVAAYCNGLSQLKGYTKCYDCTGSGTAVSCVEAAAYHAEKIYQCPGYRLPTEAEWEYAYRAGSTTSLYNNTNVVNCDTSDANANAISWNYYNSDEHIHPVGQKPANAWGLYDMAGNVAEWVSDYFEDLSTAAVTDPVGAKTVADRIFRGGAFSVNPSNVRASLRYHRPHTMETRNYFTGGRCVRTQ